MKRSVFFLILAIYNVVFIQGCGYTTKTCFLPRHIESVHIETFLNKTEQPNLENELRDKLISTFQNEGNFSISSRENANAVLKGDIVGYSRQALRYLDNETVWEYRLSISVNFEFVDINNNNTPIIKADNFTGDTTFYLSGSAAKSENSARQDAVSDLSKRILNRIITLW